MQTFFYLFLTVVFEAFGTACIQASHQFTRPLPTLGVILGYGLAFWFLSLTLRDLPLAFVYATWSGFGIILSTLIGWYVFDQRIDTAGLLGIGLVASGVVIMHGFSSRAMN